MAEAPRADTVGDDPVVQAIDQLTDVIEENARDERLLARRLRRLRDGRAAGRPWRRLLDSEPDPAALLVVGRMLARMSGASGALRRSLARAVRSEGETVSEIARRFGVTHQRVSTILRSAPDDGDGAPEAGAAEAGAAGGGAAGNGARAAGALSSEPVAGA